MNFKDINPSENRTVELTQIDLATIEASLARSIIRLSDDRQAVLEAPSLISWTEKHVRMLNSQISKCIVAQAKIQKELASYE